MKSLQPATRDDMKKKPSCFSNIKIFLVAECALMLAQGTVGAYLVSLLLLQHYCLLIFSQGFLCFWLLAQGKHQTQQPKYASCASGQDIAAGLLSLLSFHLLVFVSLFALVVQYKQSGRSVCKHANPGILFSTLVFGPACGFILGSVCTNLYVDALFIDTSEFQFILCISRYNTNTQFTTAENCCKAYCFPPTRGKCLFCGMTAIPCACLGIFLGGLLVKKLNLSALGAIRMAMLVNLISTACYVSFLFLGCDTGPVAGVTVAYGNETLQVGQRPEAPCMSHCNCYTSSVSPVCGSNGVTYLSSCFAGCSRVISTGLPPPLSQNMTGCACISAYNDFATAVPGKCPRPGCQEAFLTFLCVICACSMIGAMAQTPSVIILIRTVSPELKSYALGVLFLLLRLLGFIPPPLIFGTGIDSTCLFWSTECGDKGACLLYDNVSYRHLYVSMAIVLKVVAFLLYTTTWQCLRRNYKKYIQNHEGYVTPTEMFSSSVNLDSLGKDSSQSQVNRTKFIYSLEDHEWCENMESVL
uniref:Solute carrier organic anion transporter family, member 3A1 n=2 Tax=Sinocyclocheilus grahami TaxID=75366 RepID=A0A672MD68_SINGR